MESKAVFFSVAHICLRGHKGGVNGFESEIFGCHGKFLQFLKISTS